MRTFITLIPWEDVSNEWPKNTPLLEHNLFLQTEGIFQIIYKPYHYEEQSWTTCNLWT